MKGLGSVSVRSSAVNPRAFPSELMQSRNVQAYTAVLIPRVAPGFTFTVCLLSREKWEFRPLGILI
jgi:hypothetical protein